jgi:hypothetical protein
VLGDEGRGLFLGAAADLAEQHDRLGLRVRLEEREAVDERRADDRVAADADAGRLAEAEAGELVHDLVGQRAASGDHADGAGRWIDRMIDLRGGRRVDRPGSSARSAHLRADLPTASSVSDGIPR